MDRTSALSCAGRSYQAGAVKGRESQPMSSPHFSRGHAVTHWLRRDFWRCWEGARACLARDALGSSTVSFESVSGEPRVCRRFVAWRRVSGRRAAGEGKLCRREAPLRGGGAGGGEGYSHPSGADLDERAKLQKLQP